MRENDSTCRSENSFLLVDLFVEQVQFLDILMLISSMILAALASWAIYRVIF